MESAESFSTGIATKCEQISRGLLINWSASVFDKNVGHDIEMDEKIRMDHQEPPNPPSNGAPAPGDAVRRRQLIQRLVVRNRMLDKA